jgi:hypothetical protein
LPRRIWDLDKFFLLMLLMATSQSVFYSTEESGGEQERIKTRRGQLV